MEIGRKSCCCKGSGSTETLSDRFWRQTDLTFELQMYYLRDVRVGTVAQQVKLPHAMPTPHIKLLVKSSYSASGPVSC